MSTYDPEAFRAFEEAGWNEVADVYTDLTERMGITTGIAGDAILDAAEVAAGSDVADIATGPGFLAALAAARGARTIGIDIARAMVERAISRNPGIEFRLGPAEDLPLPDASVDAVVSAWGLPHFADPGAVFAEARRVLRPGGRLAMSSWIGPPDNQFFALLLGTLSKEMVVAPALPAGPDMFRYGDPGIADGELGAAGFTEVTSTRLTLDVLLPGGGDDLARFLSGGSVRSRAMFESQPDEARSRITASLRASVPAGSTIRLEAVVISGTARG